MEGGVWGGLQELVPREAGLERIRASPEHSRTRALLSVAPAQEAERHLDS